MSWLVEGFRALPPHGLGGVALLVLYALQSELRFGARARSHFATGTDRGTTLAVMAAALVPTVGFVLAMKAGRSTWVPVWFREPQLPGMPLTAWCGVAVGGLGILLRLWAVLTLRERYTRTLMTHDDHAVERHGPYRWIRHPGYLGSLLCLNGLALASGSAAVLAASMAATLAAYAYRIRVEDQMLLRAFGEAYGSYRREVGALIPFVH